MTVEPVLDEVERAASLYRSPGGGLTPTGQAALPEIETHHAADKEMIPWPKTKQQSSTK
jgi:hypothetical protein